MRYDCSDKYKRQKLSQVNQEVKISRTATLKSLFFCKGRGASGDGEQSHRFFFFFLQLESLLKVPGEGAPCYLTIFRPSEEPFQSGPDNLVERQSAKHGAIELPFFFLPLLLASCCCWRFVAAEDETSRSFRRAGQQQSVEGTKKQRKATWSAKGSSPTRSRVEHREKPSLEVREDLGKFPPQKILNMH